MNTMTWAVGYAIEAMVLSGEVNGLNKLDLQTQVQWTDQTRSDPGIVLKLRYHAQTMCLLCLVVLIDRYRTWAKTHQGKKIN